MISAVFIALALVLQVMTARPVQAVSMAECEAYLCLPAGFHTHGGSPTSACDPAEDAVNRRLSQRLAPLPAWGECASTFGWDTANLAWELPVMRSCPLGGSLEGTTPPWPYPASAAGSCHGTDANGCLYRYKPQEDGIVRVQVDGARLNAQHSSVSHPYTWPPGSLDVYWCPPPPPAISSGGGGAPPGQVVGPALPSSAVGGVGGGVGAAPN